MSDRNSDITLLLFAKAPIAGSVKTRLLPQCSPQQCADIAKILLVETVVRAAAHWPGKLVLSAGLDAEHPFLTDIAQRHQIELVAQCDGDLGKRMFEGLKHFGYPAAVMGCDAPHAAGTILETAYAKLRKGENVIGPSEDGGYYLLGLQKGAPALFENIIWGGDRVLSDTLNIARQFSLNFYQLLEFNDVDTWQDVQRSAHLIPPLAEYLSAQAIDPFYQETNGVS